MPEPAAPDPLASEFTGRYQRLAPALCVWALRHVSQTVRARIEVDDVLQEIWLRAFRIYRDFQGDDAAFRSWLFAVAKRVLLEIQRSAQRIQRVQLPDGSTSRMFALDQVAESVTRLTRRLVREESVLRFLEHLRGLPREDQELVSFCGLEGTTCADAARKLGIGAEAATKRWQRLRSRLREHGIAHDWVA